MKENYSRTKWIENLSVMKGIAMLFLVCAMLLCAMKPVSVQAAFVSTSHAKYTYAEYKTDLEQLESKYGDHMDVKSVGKSLDGRNLYEVVLGNPDASKHLLVIANLHAREYMTTQLVMKQIEYYMENYNKKINGKKVSKVLEKVCIHLMPSCNPDGTAISQSGFGAIRSTSLRNDLKKMGGSSRTWKANARGVDLNRNWNVSFKTAGSPGSSGYRGKKAASEPEIKAILNVVSDIKSKGKICGVVSYHSTGSILYGRCVSGASTSVKNQTSRMSRLAQSMTGYYLMPTESISQAAGCSREYFYYKAKIPCITIEVGKNPCPLAIGEFSSIWSKNKNLVIREAMLFY